MAIKEIKYTSNDYQSILADLIKEVEKTDAWKDTDFRTGLGRTLLELFSFTADQLHFYIRRLASEGYITSAKTRNSMINLGKLIGYSVKKPAAATTTLRFRLDSKKTEPVTLPIWTRCSNADGYEYITIREGTIQVDSTAIDIQAIQGKRVVEKLGDSDGSENQAFPLSYSNADTHRMSVYVGKEGYTIVPDWIGFYRKANTYTTVLDEGNWTSDTLLGTSQYRSRIVHNLDLSDPDLLSITAIDGTSYDGTQIYFIQINPVDENTVDVWYPDSTTLMLVDIKDDLDSRIYWPTRDYRVENDSGICVVDYRDEDTIEVQFGDNVIGKIPREGEEVRAEYVRNDGANGNSGKNTITTIMDTVTMDISSVVVSDITVENTVAAAGGADVETLDQIRRWAPLEARSLKRMVTLEDYEALITRIHGVLKCQVLDVYNPGTEVVPFRQAKVYVIPVGGGNISETLKKRIEDEIDDRKIVGTVRVVKDVTYDALAFKADVWYDSGYSFSEVESNIREALSDYFDPEHETREIGDDVDYENLLLTLTETEGVGSITLYINNAQKDIEILDGHYPAVGTVSLTNKGALS